MNFRRWRSAFAAPLLIAFASAFSPQAAAQAATNYTDIWWNPAESGWGLTIADHQTQIFAVWYTYRQDGSSTWFVIPGGTFSQGRRIFAGDIYQTTGPPYNTPFDPSQVHAARVGNATIDFAPTGLAAGNALFSYTVGTVSQTKQIQRQPFGDAAAAWGGDLSDIFWNPTQSGWGLTVAQHGGNLFAVWYTYDASGQPVFFVVSGGRFTNSHTFSGDMYVTTGPYFGNSVFDSSQVQAANVGFGILEFDAPSTGLLAVKIEETALQCFCDCTRGCAGRWHTRIGDWVGKWQISPQRYGYSAPDTPPAACVILYNDDWGPCVNGFQSRTEYARDPPGCPGAPELTRACPPPPACTYMYGGYGACQPNNTQTQQVVESVPAGCVGSPTPTRSCMYAGPCAYTVGPPYGACVNGLRTHTVTAQPPSCTIGRPGLTEACSDPPGNNTAFDGTFAGTYTVTVTAFLPDGSVFDTQTQTGTISVVIRNGATTVNGTVTSNAVTPNGAISFNASGSIGSCVYNGIMTAAGGSGTVHCQEPGLYIADGTWTLTRTGP